MALGSEGTVGVRNRTKEWGALGRRGRVEVQAFLKVIFGGWVAVATGWLVMRRQAGLR